MTQPSMFDIGADGKTLVTSIYTWGYTGKPFKRLTEIVEHYAIHTIADVRLKPYARDPDWNIKHLSRQLGARYQWFEPFGNLNYKGDLGPDNMLKDPEAGWRDLQPHLRMGNVMLMCVCASVTGCHRMDVCNFILGKKPDQRIEHLSTRRW